MGKRLYTRAHEQSRLSSRGEMARYDEKFRPLVERYRDEALNWDTDQRDKANISRTTNTARIGLRALTKAAGANTSDIIRGSVTGANVMADAATRGRQVTGWQRLKKLGNVAASARQQQGVVDQGMMNYGNTQASLNRSSEAIKQQLSAMRSQLVGQAVGAAAGMYAGGWWGGSGSGATSTMVDGAGGGVGTGNVGAESYNNMINGTGTLYT